MKQLTPIALFCAALGLSGSASALCVKVPEANLRQGPGTQYGKTWTVYKYMPFKKAGHQGDWLKVKDVDGETHRVYSRLVSEDMHCAVVKVSEANARSGPGTEFPQQAWSPVEKYYAFEVLEKKDSWVKVRDEVLNEGWVANWLLWMQ
jgi:SH3-like domain-containing protein